METARSLRWFLLLAFLAVALGDYISVPEDFFEDLEECDGSDDDCPEDRLCIDYDRYDADDDGPEADFVCLHKQLDPFSWQDGLGMALLMSGGFVAGMAGIGGGGLNVPILVGVMDFIVKEAAVISNTGVLGNAISQFYLNAGRRFDENPSELLIDWQLMLSILPGELAGNSLGIVLRELIPGSILLLLSLALLSALAIKTIAKGRKMRASEKEDTDFQRSYRDNLLDDLSTCLPGAPSRHGSYEDLTDADLDLMQASVREKQPVEVPWSAIAMLAGFWVFCIFQFLLIEDVLFEVENCSPGYWILALLLIPAAMAVAAAAYRTQSGPPRLASGSGIQILNMLRKFVDSEEDPVEEKDPAAIAPEPARGSEAASDAGAEGMDVDFVYFYLPLVSVCIGFFSSLLGLGGGELLGPVLIGFGLNPKKSSALTATSAGLNAAANFIHYCIVGYMAWSYHALILGTGLVSGICGRWTALLIAEAGGRASFIVFALAFLLCVSIGLVVWELTDDDLEWKAGDVCSD
uniref:Membrane transporter protein n=2 Tax=Phaeomonas parva TaxID=124430 RepID=A0A7S1XLH7_9STRA|mmetsp:Transcript_19216/g.58112  ORF Transcript_19216/g.58112 Transcript_19216/m.58112 type:complete len:521 (+) Transcript_19216:200-1762(+)